MEGYEAKYNEIKPKYDALIAILIKHTCGMSTQCPIGFSK